MTASAKSPKTINRMLRTVGRLTFAAAQIKASDTKSAILWQAEDILREVMAPVLTQHDEGLIAPSELAGALTNMHYTVRMYAEVAASEEEAAIREGGGGLVTHTSTFSSVTQAMHFLTAQGVANRFEHADGRIVGYHNDESEVTASIFEALDVGLVTVKYNYPHL